MKTWSVGRRVLLGLLLAICGVYSAVAAAGEVAPDFSLPDQSGRSVSLKDLSGQVVLINFWASWCGPCREEMPLLNELQERYAPLGFTLLGINVEEDASAAKGFLTETPVGFPILFDADNEVSKSYDVIAMPSTVIVGRDGTIRYIHHGYEAGDENVYQDQIRQAIRD